jgi:ABC-type uncharacterized transport system involved in gliding motility auxiliary subunit
VATNWLKARPTQYTAYAAVYVLVVVAALAGINVLANRYDKSYDATANKQFSLSDQTIKVVKSLKQDIQFTYFGPQNEFPAARDLLDQYSNLSPKVHVTYLDPERKPQAAKAAGYRSDSPVIIDSGTRREGAKRLTEEEVTGALIRSLKSGEREICVLSGAGEHSIDDTDSGGYSLFKQLLERDNYKVRPETLRPTAPEANKPIALGQAPVAATVEVPKDCTVLVVAGPRSDYPAPIVTAIKTYVESGGRALFMLDTSLRISRSEPPSENEPLLKLLADWGVTVNNDLVFDLSGVGQIFNLGPEIPFIVQYESHPITAPLNRIPTAFPLSRSLEIKPADKTSVSKLVATTADSLATNSIGPNGAIDQKKAKKGPLTLAVAGTYNSTPPGRFVVIGTSLAAQNSIVGSRPLDNRDLMVNIGNWLASDEDLISIRPKSPDERPIDMTTRRLAIAFWLSIVVFPLVVIGAGLATWWRRR